MKIKFIGVTNYIGSPYINVVIFKLSDGRTVVLNRERTEWSVNGDVVDMIWRDCYILDGERCDYSITADDLKDAELVTGLTEDDAPEDYFLTIHDWEAYE